MRVCHSKQVWWASKTRRGESVCWDDHSTITVCWISILTHVLVSNWIILVKHHDATMISNWETAYQPTCITISKSRILNHRSFLLLWAKQIIRNQFLVSGESESINCWESSIPVPDAGNDWRCLTTINDAENDGENHDQETNRSQASLGTATYITCRNQPLIVSTYH